MTDSKIIYWIIYWVNIPFYVFKVNRLIEAEKDNLIFFSFRLTGLISHNWETRPEKPSPIQIQKPIWYQDQGRGLSKSLVGNESLMGFRSHSLTLPKTIFSYLLNVRSTNFIKLIFQRLKNNTIYGNYVYKQYVENRKKGERNNPM